MNISTIILSTSLSFDVFSLVLSILTNEGASLEAEVCQKDVK
jgi:hypothetical protein